jgi:hypothetical protein
MLGHKIEYRPLEGYLNIRNLDPVRNRSILPGVAVTESAIYNIITVFY